MLSRNLQMKVEAEVTLAATTHLNAQDKHTALSHFTDDIIAISNTRVFASRAELASEIDEYYKILKHVNHAAWEDIHIHVINEQAATFSAKFNYEFTSIDDKVTRLRGVWTALFVLDQGQWKIRLRHESFEQIS